MMFKFKYYLDFENNQMNFSNYNKFILIFPYERHHKNQAINDVNVVTVLLGDNVQR